MQDDDIIDLNPSKEEVTSTFLTEQGPEFHIKLLAYYNLVRDKSVHIAETDILFFEFPTGEYSIRYSDLIKRAKEEREAQTFTGPKPSEI